jgi:hypothetical protein
MVTVKVTALKKMVEDLEEENVDYVEITELGGDEFEGHIFPKSLGFSGLDGNGGCIDFDDIDDETVTRPYFHELGN